MTRDENTLSSSAIEQTTKNIELAGRFLHQILDDPSMLESIPDGATVVLIPADDPELAEANRAFIEQAEQEGKAVVVRTVSAVVNGNAPWNDAP